MASARGNQNVISITRSISTAVNTRTAPAAAVRLAVEHAEARVAVGNEWAHAQLLGEREGLTIESLGLRPVWRLLL